MKPNITHHNPEPDYLRALVKATDLTQEEVAARIGISPRALRYHLSTAADHKDAPYLVQYALEGLSGFRVAVPENTTARRELPAVA